MQHVGSIVDELVKSYLNLITTVQQKVQSIYQHFRFKLHIVSSYASAMMHHIRLKVIANLTIDGICIMRKNIKNYM